MTSPELPEALHTDNGDVFGHEALDLYTREQMLEQRRIGRLEALEEAAKVLERHGQEHAYSGEGADALTACAEVIRALKNQSPLEK